MTSAGAKPKVVFIGGTRRGFMTLQALLAHHRVVGVISLQQDEHEVDRCEEFVRKEAEAAGVPCVETKFLKKPEFTQIVRDWNADVGVVVGSRVLIPESLYSTPRLGMLAVHDSLLPEYRGFAPLNWVLINGEERTGVTLFQINQGTDTGDIFGQKVVPIEPRMTAPELYRGICTATVDLILESLPSIVSGEVQGVPQDPASGSFCCARVPDDGMIDWQRMNTIQIDRLIRALTYPYPGAFTFYQGQRFAIDTAEPVDIGRCAGRVAGRVAGMGPDYVDVLTTDGTLRIRQVRTDRAMPASEIIRSIRGTLGSKA